MVALCLPLLILSLSSWSLAQNLTQVLSSTPELSLLYSLLSRYPAILNNLPRLGGTLLAPSNEALTRALNSQREGDFPLNITSPDVIEALISYHLLQARYSRVNLTIAGGRVADTVLVDETFTNLDGNPNVVFGSAFGSTGQDSVQGPLKIYSGIGDEANVIGEEQNFDEGVVHVIDRVLNFPRNCTQTTTAASLSTLVDAFRTSKLWQTVDQTPKFTCFAPTNEAFLAAGIRLESFSVDEVANILKYHSIVGDVGYTTSLEDGKEYQTMQGSTIRVTKRDGGVFVNDVEIQQGNIIMSNGVAHILNGVLVPPGTSTTGGNSTSTATGGSGSPESTGSGGGEGSSNGAQTAGSPVKRPVLCDEGLSVGR